MKRFPIAALFAMATFAFAQDKCLDLCSSCMNNDKQDVCAKVETLCKCTEMLEKLQQELNAPTAAETPEAESTVQPDSSIAKDSVTAISAPDTVSDTTPAAAPDATPAPTPEKKEADIAENEKDSHYFGVSLNFEVFSDLDADNYEVYETDLGLAGSIGFLSRWYFLYKDAASIQTGFNLMFRYAKDVLEEVSFNSAILSECVYMEYMTIAAEIPLEFRIGFPMKIFKPFVSTSVNFRKPIFGLNSYGIDVSYDEYQYSSRIYTYAEDEFDESWESGIYDFSDWEFIGYFGLGFEISHHFSLQFDWIMWSARTYSDSGDAYDDGTWKINMDVAF